MYQAKARRPSVLLTRWKLINSEGNQSILSQTAADEIFRDLDITFFDLRLLDPVINQMHLSSLSTSSCMVYHKNCVVAKFGNSGIICCNRYCLLADDNLEKQTMVEEISRRVKFQFEKVLPNENIVSSSSQSRFLLTVMDAILDNHSQRIKSKLTQLDASLNPLLLILDKSLNPTDYSRLKYFRVRVNDIAANIDSFMKTLDSAISEENSMADLEQTCEFSRDELRMLLYAHQVRSGLTKLQADQISESISDSENFFNTRMDSQRNRILQFELIMITVSFASSIISAISGILGMNLDNANYMPTKRNSFIYITVIISAGSICAFVVCIAYFKKLKIL